MSYFAGAGRVNQVWNPGGGMSYVPSAPRLLGMRAGLNVSDPWPNLGRTRRHLSGVTVDILGSPLGSSLLLVYDTTTRLLEGALTSDAAGLYDLPLYREATTWFVYTNKAGTPEVFGASSNQLVPI